MNYISRQPFFFVSVCPCKKAISFPRRFTSMRDKEFSSNEITIKFSIAELFKDNQVNFNYISSQVTDDLRVRFPSKIVKGTKTFNQPETKNLHDWLIYYFICKSNPNHERVEFHYDSPDRMNDSSIKSDPIFLR